VGQLYKYAPISQSTTTYLTTKTEQTKTAQFEESLTKNFYQLDCFSRSLVQ